MLHRGTIARVSSPSIAFLGRSARVARTRQKDGRRHVRLRRPFPEALRRLSIGPETDQQFPVRHHVHAVHAGELDVAEHRAALAIAGSLVRLRFACREVGLRSNPATPASPSPYSQRPTYTRIHGHGLFARHGSRGPKATRLLAPPNFRLRIETARSEVGARPSPRSRRELAPYHDVS
jgi:hypothetical protein